jgi:hypothetical protein
VKSVKKFDQVISEISINWKMTISIKWNSIKWSFATLVGQKWAKSFFDLPFNLNYFFNWCKNLGFLLCIFLFQFSFWEFLTSNQNKPKRNETKVMLSSFPTWVCKGKELNQFCCQKCLMRIPYLFLLPLWSKKQNDFGQNLFSNIWTREQNWPVLHFLIYSL